ncbi:hypothetical protein D3C83_89600 [compost metagenome]
MFTKHLVRLGERLGPVRELAVRVAKRPLRETEADHDERRRRNQDGKRAVTADASPDRLPVELDICCPDPLAGRFDRRGNPQKGGIGGRHTFLDAGNGFP